MDVLRQDLRYALRRLTRAPGFALVAILTLSLGIGANSAIFSLVNAVLYRPIPHATEPEQLVALFTSDYSSSQYSSSSWPDYEEFARQQTLFSDVAALSTAPLNLARGDQLERVQAELVTANYFRMLGLRPVRGRLLGETEAFARGAAPVLVLSETFWRARFAGDPAVVGSTVTANGQPYTVIGIAPAGFQGATTGTRMDAWVPIQQLRQLSGGDPFEGRGNRFLAVLARLRPDVTVASAQSRMAIVQRQLFQAYPQEWTRLNGESRLISVLAERDARVPPDARGTIFAVGGLLLGAVALVLLICCANVANLLLARAEVRTREVAIRYSLGALRIQVLRQLMLESLMLALAGGLGGLLLSIWLTDLLVSLQPAAALPLQFDVVADRRVIAFTLVATLITGVLFGLVPALQGTRAHLTGTLRGERAIVGARRFALRDGLVAGQIAIALTLAVAAGLFARTLQQMSAVDVGLDASNVVVARMDMHTQGYEPARIASFYQELRTALAARPEVLGTTLASRIELANPSGRRGVQVAGHNPQPGEEMEFPFNVVDAGYFDLLRVRIIAGRAFTAEDRADSRPVIIVNESFARRFWPGQDPLGKMVTAGAPGPREVVGVARDGKYWALNEAARPFFYLPYAQQARPVTLFVRTRPGGEQAVQQAIRAEVRARDPLLPILLLDAMERQMGAALMPQRIAGTLVGAFALLALLLAAIGVYGVTSLLVAQRIPEIGLRIALGARTTDVLGLVVRRTLLVAGTGAVAGLLLSALATRGMQSLLFGVSRFDPITLALATLTLAGSALLAGYLPARRATRVDPLVALKS